MCLVRVQIRARAHARARRACVLVHRRTSSREGRRGKSGGGGFHSQRGLRPGTYLRDAAIRWNRATHSRKLAVAFSSLDRRCSGRKRGKTSYEEPGGVNCERHVLVRITWTRITDAIDAHGTGKSVIGVRFKATTIPGYSTRKRINKSVE